MRTRYHDYVLLSEKNPPIRESDFQANLNHIFLDASTRGHTTSPKVDVSVDAISSATRSFSEGGKFYEARARVCYSLESSNSNFGPFLLTVLADLRNLPHLGGTPQVKTDYVASRKDFDGKRA